MQEDYGQGLSGSAHLYRLDVLYRDDHLMVVNKPSGLAVHRGWAADPVNATVLARWLAKRRVHPVHRLDRGTSGALVFAFSSSVAGRLQQLFQDRRVEKRYVAAVRGVMRYAGLLDHPVPKSEKGPRVDAATDLRRLEATQDRYSLVEAKPHTGRLHQIRRHLKHLSHPILCDTRYGDGKENRKARAEFGLLRMALHAAAIRFDHPESGKTVDVRAPIPDDLRVPLNRYGFTLS